MTEKNFGFSVGEQVNPIVVDSLNDAVMLVNQLNRLYSVGTFKGDAIDQMILRNHRASEIVKISSDEREFLKQTGKYFQKENQ